MADLEEYKSISQIIDFVYKKKNKARYCSAYNYL